MKFLTKDALLNNSSRHYISEDYMRLEVVHVDVKQWKSVWIHTFWEQLLIFFGGSGFIRTDENIFPFFSGDQFFVSGKDYKVETTNDFSLEFVNLPGIYWGTAKKIERSKFIALGKDVLKSPFKVNSIYADLEVVNVNEDQEINIGAEEELLICCIKGTGKVFSEEVIHFGEGDQIYFKNECKMLIPETNAIFEFIRAPGEKCAAYQSGCDGD